jgi:hypothetical protein
LAAAQLLPRRPQISIINEIELREDKAAQVAAEQAERGIAEKRAEGDRAANFLAAQKAARDSRYATRKARRR